MLSFWSLSSFPLLLLSKRAASEGYATQGAKSRLCEFHEFFSLAFRERVGRLGGDSYGERVAGVSGAAVVIAVEVTVVILRGALAMGAAFAVK